MPIIILVALILIATAARCFTENLPTVTPDEIISTSPEQHPSPETPVNTAAEPELSASTAAAPEIPASTTSKPELPANTPAAPENNIEADTEELTDISESGSEPENELESEPVEETPAQQPEPGVLPPVRLIAIDPGHQARANSAQEPIGPGASEMKEKVSSGTAGLVTRVPEYELNLKVSFLLRDELIARGYTVVMTRETNDVDMGNIERANIATQAGADIFVRVHANGSASSASKGILTISPTANNPYIPSLYKQSRVLSQCLLDEMLAATGANNSGIWETDTMTGINWSTMPVTIVEMGYMTNPDEDRLLQTPEYQLKIAKGIANGIDLYFSMEKGLS